MRQLWPETGESLEKNQNTNDNVLVSLLICLLTVSLRVSRLRNSGNELKKCRPMRQLFLHEYEKKRFDHFLLMDGILFMHE